MKHKGPGITGPVCPAMHTLQYLTVSLVQRRAGEENRKPEQVRLFPAAGQLKCLAMDILGAFPKPKCGSHQVIVLTV